MGFTTRLSKSRIAIKCANKNRVADGLTWFSRATEYQFPWKDFPPCASGSRARWRLTRAATWRLPPEGGRYFRPTLMMADSWTSSWTRRACHSRSPRRCTSWDPRASRTVQGKCKMGIISWFAWSILIIALDILWNT